MGPPASEPLGLALTRTAKLVGRGFDQALAAVDGSLPTWAILASLKSARHGKQQDIAEAVGIEGATLTHHLNRLERDGLVLRSRDPDNRRVHRVTLTDAGDRAFFRMLSAVQEFDRQLRAGLTEEDDAALRAALDRLRANVT
jgi:MarR family transcriptional regulator, transcriptional regulator for hemolysin